MKVREPNFAWMREAIYEPAPLRRRGIPWYAHPAFWALAVIIVITCGFLATVSP